MMQEDEIIYEAAEGSSVIEETSPEVIDVDIFEAFQAPITGDEFNHALLTNREIHDAHPITAITGLRKELDSIEALQTVYSDKKGNADYYEWADGLAIADAGYFVALNKDARITICTGDDIFGVVVDSAAFVGGQDDAVRDNHYGLVATSGAVLVRCELDVVEGDYVVSNAYGMATKSASGRGYKVVALHDINVVPHAMINLSISADHIDLMGAELQDLDSRMDVAESNIVSAVNVANQAYQKSSESNAVSEEAVKKALEAMLKAEGAEGTVKDMEETLTSVSNTTAQARAIAESAVTEAERIRGEAVEVANNAWTETNNLIKNLEPITTWEDPAGTGISGADYLATQMNNGIATSYDVKAVDTKTDEAMSAIIRNGKELQSLMTVIDKYSVGPYSQAYGFTLEQAASVLEEGMIYVPTEDKIGDNKETYNYTDADGNTQVSEREFLKGYLYRWGELSGGSFGWITIDKNYSEDKLNTSAPAVYFAIEPPSVIGDFGYWYTEGETVAEGYNAHTLYKWEKPEGEDGYWFAVATLAGNSQSRAVSQIRQDANSIEMSVTNIEEAYSGVKVQLDKDSAKVNSIAAWPSDAGTDKYNMAMLKQHSDGNSAHLALAAIRNISTTDTPSYQVSELGGATIVLADDETLGSYIQMDANKIDFTAGDFTIDADHIEFSGQKLDIKVDVTNIEGEINAQTANIAKKITVGDVFSADADANEGAGSVSMAGWTVSSGGLTYIGDGSDENPELYFGTTPLGAVAIGGVTAYPIFKAGNHFGVTKSGAMYASSGRIAGWNIQDDSFYKGELGATGIHLFPNGKTVADKIFTKNNKTWMLGIGSQFGVTSDGTLYASAAEITGTIHADTGNIGNWYIRGGYITNSRDDKVSAGDVFLTPDGIKFGSTTGDYSAVVSWETIAYPTLSQVANVIPYSDTVVIPITLIGGEKVQLTFQNGILKEYAPLT